MEENKNYEIEVFVKNIRHGTLENIRKDPLWMEFCRLEQKNINHTLSQDQISRYNDLKRHFDIKKTVDALQKAKDKIKHEIISKDSSPNNSVLYTAITKFDKRNG
ncbi:MAG: hypothetical protein MJ156_01315 [Alphaproteobacteria bacterium]|nr:hypothetical protein [Alphaproteobacteria bacterium]